MTERLSDEDLSEIMNYELEPSPEDVSYLAARLIDLRDHLSSGPVMPEVPSDDLVHRILSGSTLPGGGLILLGMYDAIRAELLKDQA